MCGFEKSERRVWQRRLLIALYPGSFLLKQPSSCFSFTCGLEGLTLELLRITSFLLCSKRQDPAEGKIAWEKIAAVNCG